jgi:hypothetical protein
MIEHLSKTKEGLLSHDQFICMRKDGRSIYIVAIDSTLLKAKGHIWNKSSMKKDMVPRSGIDILMQDGDSAIPRVGYLVTNSI